MTRRSLLASLLSAPVVAALPDIRRPTLLGCLFDPPASLDDCLRRFNHIVREANWSQRWTGGADLLRSPPTDHRARILAAIDRFNDRIDRR